MFLGRVGGSTGPAHIVEARPDPLNIDGSVGTRKQLELKMYLKDPRPRGNQITVVSFQHVHLVQGSFLQKNSKHCIIFF